MGKQSSFNTCTRETWLIAKYGIDEAAYKAILKGQKYKCKICGILAAESSTTGILVVDHDHKTGMIRGLLCPACNKMLGFAKDSPTTLLKAIQYLKKR